MKSSSYMLIGYGMLMYVYYIVLYGLSQHVVLLLNFDYIFLYVLIIPIYLLIFNYGLFYDSDALFYDLDIVCFLPYGLLLQNVFWMLIIIYYGYLFYVSRFR